MAGTKGKRTRRLKSEALGRKYYEELNAATLTVHDE